MEEVMKGCSRGEAKSAAAFVVAMNEMEKRLDRENEAVYVDTLVPCAFTNTGEPCTHGVNINNVPDGSTNFLLSALNMQHYSQRLQPLPKRCPHHRETVRDIREAQKEKDLEAALDSSDSEEDQESAEDQPSV